MTIKTENQVREAADQYANKAIELNELEAQFATERNDLKKREKAALAALKKEANSLKTKIRNFVKKHAFKLFKADSGTLKTEQAEVKLRNNPPKLELLDSDMTDQQVIQKAKDLGLRQVIVTKESVSKEALERLSSDDLERLGYYKKLSKSFDITPLAEPKAKNTTKITK